MNLVAPTVLRVAPAELGTRVRERFESGLRRAGSFAQLCLLGAQACLDTAGGGGSLALLYASRLGAVRAIRSALAEDLRRGEPAMPFTFIAMQPHLAGALLAQRGNRVARAVHWHPEEESWPLVLLVAQDWLAGCDRVLVGWVEESESEDGAHRSDWCILQDAQAPGSARCAPQERTEGAAPATAADWIARVAAWRARPGAPLVLRGGSEAWRFAMVD